MQLKLEIVATEHEPHRANADVRVQLLEAELVIAVDGKGPFPADWYVERHDGLRKGRHRRRLHGTGQHASGSRNGQFRRVRIRVPNLGLERTSAGWGRRLNQRTGWDQNGQRDAEGDGPQHATIFAHDPRPASR